MPSYYLVQNDVGVIMYATLRDADGDAIDMTDAESVLFHCGYEGNPDSIVVEGACTIADAENGRVRYTWTAANTAIDQGSYAGEFQITWSNGTIRTVPSRAGSFTIVVRGEVG